MISGAWEGTICKMKLEITQHFQFCQHQTVKCNSQKTTPVDKQVPTPYIAKKPSTDGGVDYG